MTPTSASEIVIAACWSTKSSSSSDSWSLELLDYDHQHLAIEMTIVSPPCLLDLGKAYVDVPPDYSAEALAEAEAAERELFTDDQWKQVRLVRAALLNVGIQYFDARPSNIMFPREHPSR